MNNFTDGKIPKEILTALHNCYGNLEEPNFHKVYKALESDVYQDVIKSLQEIGAEITDRTDFNDDVSTCLTLEKAGDHVRLSLSGVGPFAAVLHWSPEERYSWVTHPEEAPTPLAATVARTVQKAGFEMLDRSLVAQTIAANWYDGSTEVTLYQLLFTDTDVIP